MHSLTVHAGDSTPRVAMTSNTFFMASGTASASVSLWLRLHSYITCMFQGELRQPGK